MLFAKLSHDGVLTIQADSDLEAYALTRWIMEFKKKNNYENNFN